MVRSLRLLIVVLAFCVSCATQTPTFEAPQLIVPKRSAEAISGSSFGTKLLGANESGREQAIIDQYRQGNIPEFLRHFSKVRFVSQTRSGKQAEVTLWVLPDYLGVGTNQDYLRTPMTPLSAQTIADQFGLLLPTVKIVDAIYHAASVKLDPQPFKPGPQMVTVGELVRHNKVVQASLHDQVPQGLVAGHKKDIVITNLLLRKTNRVAIYGWHLRSGTAIQPLTTVHGNWYADYSHGVRLMAATMIINDVEYKVADVLRDPELSSLISYEGPMKILRYPNDGKVRTKWWPQS
ncbi:MAG: hypothetical protein H7249_20840 [Chitinophagaceae bacterium]|nr:hypothetical protein [Oligoflexus sp.]